MTDEEIHLEEYRQLKTEQRERIQGRNQLLYVTFVATAASAAFAFTGQRYMALLCIPVVCIVLGWLYISNDRKVSLIREYIRCELTEALSTTEAIFGWESFHRLNNHRSKAFWLIIDLLVFPGLGLAAIITWLVTDSALLSPAILIAIVELFGLAAIAREIGLSFVTEKSDE